MKKIIINDMIKKYRDIYNMNQDELGEKLGISGKTVSSWEIGRTKPNMGYVQVLADLFGITTDILIYGHSELTEIPIDLVKFDDYFPLKYSTNLSAGSFDELMESEPDAVVYVPITFQSKKKRLIAFKVNGSSMNNIIEDGSIVVVEHIQGVDVQDGSVIVALLDGLATVKRIYYKDNNIILLPDSTDKTHLPITINEDNQLYVIGKVIWHMNSDDIAKYY